jgi:hypothetical protein
MPTLFALILGLLLSLGNAFADDVTDWIEDGLQAYRDGRNQDAISSLDYASQLIRQQKGAALEELFPAAPAGWTRGESSSVAVGSALMGGGTGASASYERENGEEGGLEISIATDNPMIGMMAMALSNPSMMAASGQKMIKLGSRKAMLEFDANDLAGTVTLLAGDAVLVTIDGYAISEDELRRFAALPDYDAIEKAAVGK